MSSSPQSHILRFEEGIFSLGDFSASILIGNRYCGIKAVRTPFGLTRQLTRRKVERTRAAPSRKKAMCAFTGIWKDRPQMKDSAKYVRLLRSGRRLDKLGH